MRAPDVLNSAMAILGRSHRGTLGIEPSMQTLPAGHVSIPSNRGGFC